MKIEDRIEAILDEKVRAALQEHGGGVRLVEYRDHVAWIELQGACLGCPAADLSTRVFIEEVLQAELPEIQSVELTQEIDPELMEYTRKIIEGKLK